MTFTWIYISSQVGKSETCLDLNFIAGKNKTTTTTNKQTNKHTNKQKQPVKFTWIYISSQVGKSETCLDLNFIAGKQPKTKQTNKQTKTTSEIYLDIHFVTGRKK